ncbi:peptidoglycan DD-metalloendopeptidase family protein [Robertmurraya sp. Marseille-Q9965]
MRDFIKRLLIAGIMALFISLLFIGVKYPQAASNDLQAAADHWMWPADGVITDTFGTRGGKHYGIDIAAGLGTPIYSVDEGIVTRSYHSSSYGNVIFVKHPNRFETVYAHLSKRNVKEGQTIKQGDIIGEMGSTGRSTGVHLHFEVHKNEWTVGKENALNPVAVLGNVGKGAHVQAMKEVKDKAQVAGVMDNGQVAGVAETSDESIPTTEATDVEETATVDTLVKYLPNSDYLLVMEDSEKTIMSLQTDNDAESEDITYKVEKGDTLWNIAEEYETSVGLIMVSNQLEDDLIVPDQELVIKPLSTDSYIVHEGDSLSTIAKHLNTTVQELMEINHLKSDVIQPQQVLNINVDQ